MKKNNEGQVTLTSTQAAAIIEALLAHEGVRKEDRIDRVRTRETGATALPALAPLVKAWEEQHEPLARFRSELEAVAEALWALRARFNLDDGDLDDGDPGCASHTFAAEILATIASYVSCVAEDGTWSEETFEGLRGNIERELRRGVQEGHRPITAPSLVSFPALMTQEQLMAAQGFAKIDHDPDGAVAEHVRRIKDGMPTPFTFPECEHHSKEPREHKTWDVAFRKVPSHYNAREHVRVTASSADEAREIVLKGATASIKIDFVTEVA